MTTIVTQEDVQRAAERLGIAGTRVAFMPHFARLAG
jgi:hypothetical protein